MDGRLSTHLAVLPVILAGGGGTRLWPLSRSYYPKQFLELTSDHSLLQETLLRVPAVAGLTVLDAMVVCNEEHRFLVAEQCRQLGAKLSHLVLEPAGRNTAPALTAAAALASRDGADPVLVMMPADQVIADSEALAAALVSAVAAAEAGKIATFGVVPSRPETGYGYIEAGASLGEGSPACYELSRFREKPDAATAQEYLASGRFLWNSGIFVMRASVWLALAERFCPEICSAASAAVSGGASDGDFFRLQPEAFVASPSNSIDYAVMEPLAASDEAAGAVVIALEAGWSDVGSWASLRDVSPKDTHGNVLRGDVCALDSHDNIVYSGHRLVATLGCDNLAIIETADSVMVASLERTEDVKSIVAWLESADREERLTHRRVYRPWGSFENIDSGPGFKVKRISVAVGAALSLQMHHRRAENWVVVSGTARVTRDDEIFLLGANEATYIPIGARHRLENVGEEPLELIEVQSGSYLEEDDIVRFDDRYKRI